MAEGFIRDKLEIKFVILYVMSRVTAPIPMEGVQQLTMIDGGIEYSFVGCTPFLPLTSSEKPSCSSRAAMLRLMPEGVKDSSWAAPVMLPVSMALTSALHFSISISLRFCQ